MNSLLTLALVASAIAAPTKPQGFDYSKPKKTEFYVGMDPRPYYLVNNMTDSPLKKKLQSCANGPFSVTGFSIGHRGGATLQVPEETEENTIAGARMGAGVLECDVAFTSDRKLVCRHDICDLHTTTDILVRPALAAKCTVPFTPANDTASASATCCTSDITLAEFNTLCSKSDGFNASALTPEAYQAGGPNWRTNLYDTCGTTMTVDTWIDLVDSLPVQRNFTPELKTPPAAVPMPFNGYTQEQFAQDLIDAFRAKNIPWQRVWLQSFLYDDILYWLRADRDFGKQAVFLQEYDTPEDIASGTANLTANRAAGVNIIGAALPMLVTTGSIPGSNKTQIVESDYSKAIKAAGMDIIGWTFERSGPATTVRAREEYYFGSILNITNFDGQYMEFLDVLAQKVKVVGLFTDWASTVTYYANCFGLKGPQNIYN